jgi:hypothetical protein
MGDAIHVPKFYKPALQQTETPMLSTRWWLAARQRNQMSLAFSIQDMLILALRFLALQGNFQTLFNKSLSHCGDRDG